MLISSEPLSLTLPDWQPPKVVGDGPGRRERKFQSPYGLLPFPLRKEVPQIPGALSVILGAALFIKSLSLKARGDTTSETVIGANWMKVGLVIPSLIAYVIFLSRIGYIICTFLLLGLLLNIYQSKGWPIRLIAAALVIISLIHKAVHLILPPSKSNVLSTENQEFRVKVLAFLSKIKHHNN